MSHFVSTENTEGFQRVELREDAAVGVYCIAFAANDSVGSARDALQDNFDAAKAFCLDEWGVPLASWSPIEGQGR